MSRRGHTSHTRAAHQLLLTVLLSSRLQPSMMLPVLMGIRPESSIAANTNITLTCSLEVRPTNDVDKMVFSWTINDRPVHEDRSPMLISNRAVSRFIYTAAEDDQSLGCEAGEDSEDTERAEIRFLVETDYPVLVRLQKAEAGSPVEPGAERRQSHSVVWVPFDATNHNWKSRLLGSEEEEDATVTERSIYEVMRRHNYHYEAARLTKTTSRQEAVAELPSPIMMALTSGSKQVLSIRLFHLLLASLLSRL